MTKFLQYILTGLLVSTLCVCSIVKADNIKIGWTSSPTNTDGSALVDLASFNVYKSATTGVYTSIATNVPANITTTVLQVASLPISWTGNGYGTQVSGQSFSITWDLASTGSNAWYFVVEAVNNNGVLSDFSPEVPYWQTIPGCTYKLAWGTTIGSQPTVLTNIYTTPAATFSRNLFTKTVIYFRPLAVYADGRTNIYAVAIPVNNKKPGAPVITTITTVP